MWKNIFPILKAELFDDLNLKDEEGPKGGNPTPLQFTSYMS